LTPFAKVGKQTIYHGDFRDVMPAVTCQLVVTSPPYNCGKTYDEYDDGLRDADYWQMLAAFAIASHASIGRGCRVICNVPWWIGKKPRRSYPDQLMALMRSLGFLFTDKITWVKGAVGAPLHTSNQAWGTFCSPSGPAIRCVSEPILMFSKESRGRGVTNGEGKGACVRNEITTERFAKLTQDVWLIPAAGSKGHPATFPVELPKRLIELYTFEQDVVCDPFMGSGTTLLAAEQVGRSAIGIEVSERYCELATQRLENYISSGG